ncbi:MAG: YihY/virulence factor BrkB family protein, partial [Clostridia bacterium]|nr:YihY/virulence factor BrkB family protein [Clostridia bacterium]
DRHDLIKSAAQISYYNIIAFLTISVVLVYIANFFPDFIEKIFDNIENIIPNVVSSVFSSTISQVNIPKNITIIIFTTIATLWFASRSFHGFIEAFNKIYDLDNGRKLIKAKALSIFFTLGIFLVIVLMFYLSVMGETFAGTIFKDLEFLKAVNFIRRYGAIFGLLLIMTAIYFYLPNMKVKIRHAIPGALFTSGVWIVLSKFFSFYVANINSFSWILGSLGSLFVFMIWIFWLSIVILIGGEINSYLIQKETERIQLNN